MYFWKNQKTSPKMPKKWELNSEKISFNRAFKRVLQVEYYFVPVCQLLAMFLFNLNFDISYITCF